MINSGEVSGVVEALEQPIQGDVTPTQSLTGEVQHGSGVSGVRDVLVNEESVVDNNKVAHIDLTPYAEKEDVYDKQTIDTALEGKADTDDIPTDLSDLQDDSNHRLVTDEEKTEWSGKADTSDIPTALSQLDNDDNYVQDADYQHTDNNFTDADKSAIGNIPTALADLSDDSTHRLVTDTEKTTWNAKSDFSGSYNDLTDKPTIPSVSANPSTTTGTLTAIEIDGVGYAVQGSGGGAVSSVNGQTGDVVLDAEDVGALPDNTPLFSGSYNDLTDKPTIPDELADLQDDSTHRLVTDTEKSTWDNKSDFSGSYNDLTDKPTIPDAQIQSDWEQSDNTKVDFIKNKPTIPSAQVNSDWNASSGVAQILNKPTLGTASALDVATSGDASTTQVVKGDDSRLTDSRNAADVYSWAKASTKPSYTASEVGAIPSTDKGANGGVAELDSNGKVPSSQLPSYVDDVIEGYYDSTTDRFYEESTFEHVITPESGKSWVDVATNKSYRWTGSVYTRVDEGVQLGETSSTAYRGDRGKTAYDHSQLTSGNPHNVSKSDVGLGNVDNTSDSTKKTNFTGSIASGNTGFTTGGDVYTALQNKVNTETGKGLSTNDFTNDDKAMIGNIYANNTVLTTDRTPYLNRPCLTPTGFSSYVREKLIGCSVAWNQLVENGNFASGTTGWSTYQATISASNNVCTMVRAVASGSNSMYRVVTKQPNHKYLWSLKVKNNVGSNSIMVQWFKSGTGGTTTSLLANTAVSNNYTTYSGIIATDSADADGALIIFLTTTTVNNSIDIKDIQVIDLTLAFGSTVADTLYAMTNNGGIDWLRNHNYPIDQYTQYGYGLYSSKPSAKKVVGKNKLGFSNINFTIGNVNFKSQDNTVIANGTASTNISSTSSDFKTNFKFTLNAGTYYFSINSSGVPTVRMTSDDTTLVQGNGTFTLTQKTELYIGIYIPANTVFSLRDLKINLTVGSTATTYEPYSCTTYSLGSTELRGHLIVQNGEIVAEGDVRESNGNTNRTWDEVDLGNVTWYKVVDGSYTYFRSDDISGMASEPYTSGKLVCAKYTTMPVTVANMGDKAIRYYNNQAKVLITDSAYSDATTLKTSLSGVKLAFIKSTPTTETSSPFADPMSLNGATTEEYVDDRTIPVPVGHETQYMGQSEDVVEIPSMPQSDGIRYMKAITSGGKTQLVWEDDVIEDVSDCIVPWNDEITISDIKAYKIGHTVTCKFTLFVASGHSSGDYVARFKPEIRPLISPYFVYVSGQSVKQGCVMKLSAASGWGGNLLCFNVSEGWSTSITITYVTET